MLISKLRLCRVGRIVLRYGKSLIKKNREKGGEMTQTLYAHMNKKKKRRMTMV
jgi:hypothetical protein